MVVLPSGFQDRRIQQLCHSSPLIINSLRKCAESAVAHLVELRMQRGHFCRAHGAWHLRYRVNAKQLSVKLADCTDEYRTLTSVRPLAEPYLQTTNSGQQANGHLTPPGICRNGVLSARERRVSSHPHIRAARAASRFTPKPIIRNSLALLAKLICCAPQKSLRAQKNSSNSVMRSSGLSSCRK